MKNVLTGKVAIITGAAGGIGAATAAMFVRKGAKVVMADVDEVGLVRAAAAIANKDAVRSLRCDVTNVDDMEAAVRLAADAFGGLDAAILNAGIEGDVKPIESLTVGDFEKVMAVSVTGAFVGLKTCFPALKARGGGAVLMTSSTSGKIGAAGLAPYTAAKHGLIGLMRAAALEGAPFKIRVNTVNPCPVETRMMRSLEQGFSPGDSEAMHKALIEAIPLKRYAEPDDVAEMFAFLASDAAKFATGGVYMIDGGMLAGLTRA